LSVEKDRQLNIPVQADFDDFLRASDLMGVQRHLKVIGIFARICHRDGKPRYLADVPRFFAYIEAVLADRPKGDGPGYRPSPDEPGP
jgi:hypothetical protein